MGSVYLVYLKLWQIHSVFSVFYLDTPVPTHPSPHPVPMPLLHTHHAHCISRPAAAGEGVPAAGAIAEAADRVRTTDREARSGFGFAGRTAIGSVFLAGGIRASVRPRGTSEARSSGLFPGREMSQQR